MSKDRRLGRGLAALLGTPIEEEFGQPTPLQTNTSSTTSPPESGTASAPFSNSSKGSIGAAQVADQATPVAAGMLVPVELIDNNPFQPRREFNSEEIDSLAESIKEHQQIQPILVRKTGDRYQIISGERRFRATIRAGLTHIRAEVREADDRLVAELAIIENLQRKDLNPIEKALSFKRYIQEHRCTQDDLAKRLKIDRSTIANLMRLLELPEPILAAIQTDKISAGHARALLPLGDEVAQLEFANRIQAEQWSVRQTEAAVADKIATDEATESGADPYKKTKQSKRSKSEHLQALERELKMALGTNVEIRQGTGGKGKIVISFSNSDEFERIRESLSATSGSRFRLAS